MHQCLNPSGKQKYCGRFFRWCVLFKWQNLLTFVLKCRPASVRYCILATLMLWSTGAIYLFILKYFEQMTWPKQERLHVKWKSIQPNNARCFKHLDGLLAVYIAKPIDMPPQLIQCSGSLHCIRLECCRNGLWKGNSSILLSLDTLVGLDARNVICGKRLTKPSPRNDSCRLPQLILSYTEKQLCGAHIGHNARSTKHLIAHWLAHCFEVCIVERQES